MKSYGELFEQVISEENLLLAMRRAARGKRDREPVRAFLVKQDVEIAALRSELANGEYAPKPFHCFRIYDPKPRLISCSAFRDRVVHQALCAVICPLLERSFIYDSYGCRVGKGIHRAIRRAQFQSRRHGWFWKADIRRFFDSIPLTRLEAMLLPRFREVRMRELLAIVIRHGAREADRATARGLPIGSLTSQWFANCYLDTFDHWLLESYGAKAYVRYMDDFVVWGSNKDALFACWQESSIWLRDSLGLALKQEACFVAPVTEGLPFLGHRIYPGFVRKRGIRLRRTRRRIRKLESAFEQGRIAEASFVDRVRALSANAPLSRWRDLAKKGTLRCRGLRS